MDSRAGRMASRIVARSYDRDMSKRERDMSKREREADPPSRPATVSVFGILTAGCQALWDSYALQSAAGPRISLTCVIGGLRA